MERLNKAKEAIKDKKMSLRTAVQVFNLPRSTLHDFLTAHPDKKFKLNRGNTSKVLQPDEEVVVASFISEKVLMGWGSREVQVYLQDVLERVKQENPNRITGYESTSQLPNMGYVYRFCKRHNIIFHV